MQIDFWVLVAMTILWFAWMTWLSHQNGEDTGKASRDLARCLEGTFPFVKMDLEQWNRHLRKMAHVVVFAVLTVLLGLTLTAASVALPKLPFLVAVSVWAWADEKTKIPIPGRHFSWQDVGLNLMGILMGAGVLWLFAM